MDALTLSQKISIYGKYIVGAAIHTYFLYYIFIVLVKKLLQQKTKDDYLIRFIDGVILGMFWTIFFICMIGQIGTSVEFYNILFGK